MLNRSSCFPEIAGDAAVFFDFDSRRQGLQYKLEELLSWTPEQKEKLLTIQRERLRLYSWEKAAQELANVYRRVAWEHNNT